MWRTVAGAGVLVALERRVLMVLHERNGRYRWELPSGVVGPDESFEQAAVRETLEETGLCISVRELLCTAVMDEPEEEYRGVNLYFRAQALNDAVPHIVSTSEPISAAAYVDVTQIRSQDIHPVDRRILRMWQRKPDRQPFFVHVKL